jgi:hypothetical protein
LSKRKKNRPVVKLDLTAPVDSNLSAVFLFLIGVVPLLVRARIIDYTAPRIISALLNSGLQSDIFNYYKWWLVMAGTVIVLLLLLYKIVACNYEIRASYINIPVAILIMLVLLSTLAAQYKSIALVGIYNQRDGALTLLASLALCLAAANTFFKPWFSRWLTVALLVFTFISTGLIWYHFTGHQVMQLQWFKNLVLPAELRSYAQGEFITTQSNPNYVSGLASALFAFFFSYVLLDADWRRRWLFILPTLAAFIMILASLSSSGFVTVAIISPLLVVLIFLSRNKTQTLLAGGATLLLCAVIFWGMISINPSVYDTTFGSKHILPTTSYMEALPHISALAKIINFNPPLACAATQPSRAQGGSEGAVTAAPPADTFNLPAPGWSAGTGRSYIWSETLKLILKRPLLGYGQGTLAYYFPQNDINKIANMNDYTTLITKPHNMYLEVAYGSGLLAGLALLALFIMHFYHTGRRLLNAAPNQDRVLAAALFLFFCAFAVQGLFNDVFVDGAAIFWILLGAGVSVNHELSLQPPGGSMTAGK